VTIPILFLDIDGVLNSTRYWDDRGRNLPLGKGGALDPDAIERLNTIVSETGCRVVLSSSWRGKGNSPKVEAMLQERGFLHTIHDSTPAIFTNDSTHEERWREITQWLDEHMIDGDFRFVVLDDDPDAWSDECHHAVVGRFVNTNYLVGLQQDGVDLAVEWLNAIADGKPGGSCVFKPTSMTWVDDGIDELVIRVETGG